VKSIEDARTRSEVTSSKISDMQQRCDLALSPDGMNDGQLLTHARKGLFTGYRRNCSVCCANDLLAYIHNASLDVSYSLTLVSSIHLQLLMIWFKLSWR